MDTFEQLLKECINALERFVYLKISNKHDAEDVLQDTLLAAHEKFRLLKNEDSFKPWIISIAKNKCNDYYRKKAKEMNIPLDTWAESILVAGRYGIVENEVVSATIEKLGDKEKQILYLYFFKDMSQNDIAQMLNIPVGTVKSRLYHAKQSFKEHYPYRFDLKGAVYMKKLPNILPKYSIKELELPAFDVKCEELMGLCIVPRLNEKVLWGSYEIPSRKLFDFSDVKVVGKMEVHEIEGVEIAAVQHTFDKNGKEKQTERQFVAQLTDTHCRYLAESHEENGVKKLYTFLDSDVFANNWGYGKDNCGFETCMTKKGLIERIGTNVTFHGNEETVDIVGRYEVNMNGKSFDTVCIMNVGHFNHRIVIEQYLDKQGRTVLWRRFNRNDWAYKRYGKTWTEMLPENERLTVNGEVYVHWYDCITDYVL